MDTIPRRIRIDLATPAEKAIRDAMAAVEHAGCHVLLTDAVNLLSKALDKVADFVDLPEKLTQFWVPEHPDIAVYRAQRPRREGKLGELEILITTSIHEALQFKTKEECDHWIVSNPRPVFVARQHAIDLCP